MMKAINVLSILVFLTELIYFNSLDPVLKATLLLVHLLLPHLILIFWLKYDIHFEKTNRGEKSLIPNDPSFGFFLSSFSMFIYWLRAKPIDLLPGQIPNPFDTSRTFIFYMGIVAILYFSVIFLVTKNGLRKKSIISWAMIFGFPYVLGSAYGLNEWFDNSTPTLIRGNIIKKTKSGGRFKEFSLDFQKTTSGEIREYSIRSSDFYLIGENGRAVINVKRGLLNVPWLSGIDSN